jgi:acetyl esterase/lipase
MKRLIILTVLVLTVPVLAQPRTSENDPRLAEFLKQRPQADADRDGVLTIEEAKAFQELVRQWRERNKPRDPDHANIAYGDHERHVIDLYLADSDTPTPLVIFIHGGGFVAGSKDNVNGPMVTRLNEAGISVAAINYRYITTDPLPAPFEDAARAVQFLRHHAKDHNLDRARFAATGGSAGAGTSLYLAFHDDMADADSDDPIARQSTRLTCAQVSGAQVSYDIFWWETIGLPGAQKHPSFERMFAVSDEQPFDSPAVRDLMRRTAPINHLTADDPPVMLNYNVPNEPVTEATTLGALVHHPKHGIVLKERMDELGIECIVVYPGGPEVETDPVSFLIERLGHGR